MTLGAGQSPGVGQWMAAKQLALVTHPGMRQLHGSRFWRSGCGIRLAVVQGPCKGPWTPQPLQLFWGSLQEAALLNDVQSS